MIQVKGKVELFDKNLPKEDSFLDAEPSEFDDDIKRYSSYIGSMNYSGYSTIVESEIEESFFDERMLDYVDFRIGDNIIVSKVNKMRNKETKEIVGLNASAMNVYSRYFSHMITRVVLEEKFCNLESDQDKVFKYACYDEIAA